MKKTEKSAVHKSLYLDKEVYDFALKEAKEDSRSFSQYIALLIKKEMA